MENWRKIMMNRKLPAGCLSWILCLLLFLSGCSLALPAKTDTNSQGELYGCWVVLSDHVRMADPGPNGFKDKNAITFTNESVFGNEDYLNGLNTNGGLMLSHNTHTKVVNNHAFYQFDSFLYLRKTKNIRIKLIPLRKRADGSVYADFSACLWSKANEAASQNVSEEINNISSLKFVVHIKKINTINSLNIIAYDKKYRLIMKNKISAKKLNTTSNTFFIPETSKAVIIEEVYGKSKTQKKLYSFGQSAKAVSAIHKCFIQKNKSAIRPANPIQIKIKLQK